MVTSPSNQLLAALPPRESKRLLPHLELVSLEAGNALYEPETRISHVYFPETSVITKLVILEDGSTAEVGMVGRDGLVGSCLVLGSHVFPFRAVVQVAGSAWRMSAEAFTQELRRSGAALVDLLHRYTADFLVQVSYLAACNQHHSVKQRCCRMLLSTFDRLQTREMLFTQDFLAMFLGVRRASIGEVMSELKKAGLLTYSRGHIALLDRPGLEACTCECYRNIRDASKKLFGGG